MTMTVEEATTKAFETLERARLLKQDRSRFYRNQSVAYVPLGDLQKLNRFLEEGPENGI